MKMTAWKLIGMVLGFSSLVGISFAQEDYLTPPGAPGSEATRMKTLNQIEPRTVITNLPWSITNAGSYYLINPLLGSDSADGIVISVSEVKLDLNGYALNGTPGSWDAIKVVAPCENISIRNGVIRNWGRLAVNATAASDTVFMDLKAANNGWGGLYAGPNSLIERCSIYGNGWNNPPPQEPPMDDGIAVGSFSTVKDCKIKGNKGAGIHTFSHSKISGCTSMASTNADGIHAEDYCTVRDCVASQNRSHGIRIASKCRVLENTCAENGTNAVPPNYVAGIAVEGNTTLVERNIVSGNMVGIRFMGSGNLIILNSSSKNQFDYYPLAPNPVFTSNFVGIIATLNTSQGGSITNLNPWANWSFKDQP